MLARIRSYGCYAFYPAEKKVKNCDAVSSFQNNIFFKKGRFKLNAYKKRKIPTI